MIIEHRAFSVAPGDWAHGDFTQRLRRQLEQLGGGSVCELGGGARPALDLEFLNGFGLRCLVVDLSESELRKAPPGYSTLVADVSSPEFSTGEHDEHYDLVFSRVLAEHVRDARQFHRNVRRILRPGGLAMHFFPTFWWPPFVANRVLPEGLAEWILLRIDPGRERSGSCGKFRAYYHWCFGPTRRQIARLASVGFSVEHCVAYFGEPTAARGRVLSRVDEVWTEAMLSRPNYHFTSYAAYTLRALA
jgi:SAM-dependent methyltransferase